VPSAGCQTNVRNPQSAMQKLDPQRAVQLGWRSVRRVCLRSGWLWGCPRPYDLQL
jgi:hypothetical protein